MSTPDLHLRTCFVLDDHGRIISTREPGASRAPLFTVIKGRDACAWAVRADVPTALASELERLARDEPPALDLRQAPVHSHRYISLLQERIAANELSATKGIESDGPAFEFPESLVKSSDIVVVEDER